MRPKIELQNVGLTFHTDTQDLEALKDVSLAVQPGEFVTIIGPSGCGKSTLLNVIAGLVDYEHAIVEGLIEINRDVANRGLGFVFQRDALLPWRTVADNIAVGLEVRGVSRADRSGKVHELISLVGLEGFDGSFPHQLSGGMRQRVSIARALAYDPDVILMDEPFGALDAQTRLMLQQQLLNLWERTHKTIMFVTHDLAEAVTLGSRVILMTPRPGKIREIYDVNIPYPRAVLRLAASEEFTGTYRRIWQVLSTEIEEMMTHAP
jgi:NitT/TauT family transport system ATP-binding protein